ncbi:MAG: N-acetylmuramoyl-L-alanine amidase family protein [bacterium]
MNPKALLFHLTFCFLLLFPIAVEAKKTKDYQEFIFNDEDIMRVKRANNSFEVLIKPRAGEGTYKMGKRVLDDWRNDHKKITKYNGNKPLYQHRFVPIPFWSLNDALQGAALKAMFPEDASGAGGWRHRVTYKWETVSLISGVFAKREIGARHLIRHNKLRNQGRSLKIGDVVEIPWDWLREGLELQPLKVKEPLLVKADSKGRRFAAYKMSSGDTIYSSVVARFTGRLLHEEVDRMAKELLELNDINNARLIQTGQLVRFPLEWVSDEYLDLSGGGGTVTVAENDDEVDHEDDEEELHIKPPPVPPPAPDVHLKKVVPQIAKNSVKEAKKEEVKKAPIQEKKSKSKSSKNVVSTKDQIHIILDSGHGGADPGAVAGDPKNGDKVYEDDVVYDIVQRMLPDLKQSGFVVHETVRDRSQSAPINFLSEKVDRDEELLVNPRYGLENARVGVNMRVFLVNHIYLKLRKKGVPSDQIVLISVHGDALHDSLRGAMIYYPDRRVRSRAFGIVKSVYTKRDEYTRRVTFNAGDNKLSEKYSKDLGETLIDSFRDAKWITHRSNAVRGYYIRGGKKSLPAILRYSKIPTSVLVEVANLNNSKDRKLILDSRNRQKIAHAMVNGLESHFRGSKGLLAQR